MGHMLNQTQMDIIVRWHRMRGFLTLWLPGTDHAGIATQMMVERQLAIEGKERRDLGREKFVERVWEWKRHYGGAIQEQMKRLGASVDWDREYFTMDENLSRAVREVFVCLYEEGLIYRGKYIVNWCPRCETAISDLEVKHEEVQGKLYEIRYPVIGTKEFITVATTRPETMLGDTAVAVNEKDERYKRLHGKKVLLPLMQREIPIITDELAQPEFGTGAVKVTPAHDPNDFQAGLRHNLPQIDVMDQNARMNQNAGAYVGLDRFEARKRVLVDLRAQGFLVGEKDYTISLGKCDRCGTVVEPRLSTQWFIKIKPLAERATEVVENGEITIVPENYKQIYLNWMHNIHDWCISRQLWWGHRIPAWHCACGEIIVAREAPGKCTKCGSAEITQDRDVLDTWFSSGLLPFTTLGWPQKTRDQDVFYPTTLLITAYEILFFWVARMIMCGCHFMKGHKQDSVIKQASGWCERKDDSVPFRQVYIHALVRDAERQKMSKTKGNVIDPLEIIQRFGTDATRFTLAAMAAPGTDIAFSESRTEGYRNFANKIWNAARFMFMNVERAEQAGIWSLNEFRARELSSEIGENQVKPTTLEDRWILSRFNAAVAEVNASLGSELGFYRFDNAANAVYDFFWGEFCDWYIELTKPRLLSSDADQVRVACGNLVGLFEAALRLLHPFMPFITEEIWQVLYEGKPPLKSISKAPYPGAIPPKDGVAAERKMGVVTRITTAIRDGRARLKIEPKLRVPVQVFMGDEGREILRQNQSSIEKLANVSLQLVPQPPLSFSKAVAYLEGENPDDSSNFVTEAEAYANLATYSMKFLHEAQIDVPAERKRLEKELSKIEQELSNGQRQLSNEQFLAKAPPKIVEGMRQRAQELSVLREKTQSKLGELKTKTETAEPLLGWADENICS